MKQYNLKNGIKINTHTSSKFKTCSICVSIKNGISIEGSDEKGISHLLEHYITADPRYSGEKSIFRRKGVDSEIYTENDKVVYLFRFLIKDSEKVIEEINDFIFNIKKDKDIFGEEKEMLIDEIDLQKSKSEEDIFLDLVSKNISDATSFPLGSAGELKSITNLDLGNVINWHQKTYHSENVSIGYAGPKRFMKKIKEVFSLIPENSNANLDTYPIGISEQESEPKNITIERIFERKHSAVFFVIQKPENEAESEILSSFIYSDLKTYLRNDAKFSYDINSYIFEHQEKIGGLIHTSTASSKDIQESIEGYLKNISLRKDVFEEYLNIEKIKALTYLESTKLLARELATRNTYSAWDIKKYIKDLDSLNQENIGVPEIKILFNFTSSYSN